MTDKENSSSVEASRTAVSQSATVKPLQFVMYQGLILFVISILLLFVAELPFTGCMYPYFGALNWSLVLVFGILLIGELLTEVSFMGGKIDLARLRERLGTQYIFKPPWLAVTVVIYAVLFLLVRHLGLYSTSPWQVDEPPIVLKQFSVVLSPGGRQTLVQPNKSMQIPRGNFVIVSAEIDPQTTTCRWSSLHGGAVQTPNQCSTYYTPPLGSDYDLLDVELTSACNTQQSINHLLFLVAP